MNDSLKTISAKVFFSIFSPIQLSYLTAGSQALALRCSIIIRDLFPSRRAGALISAVSFPLLPSDDKDYQNHGLA